MHWFRGITTFAILLPVIAACGDDDDPGGPPNDFIATLSGSEEVPPVPSTATGSASLSISGDQILYTISVVGLANPVVAHIHIAATGVNGPVRLNLCGTGDPVPACATGDGTLAEGTNGVVVGTPAITFDSLVSAIRSGGAYVNVHTDDGVLPPNTGPGDMASGEIRGQIQTE